MNNPEALRLADHLESRGLLEEAAELRRLSAENEMLHQRHRDDNAEYTRVLAQRSQMLAALRHAAAWFDAADPVDTGACHVRALIKAVEEPK